MIEAQGPPRYRLPAHGANEKLSLHYTQEAFEFVQKIYADDFKTFGYDTEPYWPASGQ